MIQPRLVLPDHTIVPPVAATIDGVVRDAVTILAGFTSR
jgi:hypothetical protein